MGQLEEIRVHCPYCGAGFIVLVEVTFEQQDYIEDCRSCCSPINFEISVENGIIQIITKNHNE